MKFFVLRPYRKVYPNEKEFYNTPEEATADLVRQLKDAYPCAKFTSGKPGVLSQGYIKEADYVLGTTENYHEVDEQFFEEYALSKGKFLDVGTWLELSGWISREAIDRVGSKLGDTGKSSCESVNSINPQYYRRGMVECIDAIEAATAGLGGIHAVCVANIIKYVWRAAFKGGIEDYKKARWYLEKLIAMEE